MTADQVRAAADLLWDRWSGGRRLDALPPELRPASREDGYAIQAELDRRSGAPRFGWKIAATSTAGQRHIGVDGPLAGRLLRERAFASGSIVPFGANHMRVAEAEFAFRMGRELAPRAQLYSVDEAMAAVDTLHPAIEIPDSRYDDFTIVGAAQLIADNACAHYFVLGDPAPESWRGVDLIAHAVTGRVNDAPARTGVGANVLGDPRVALAWLANELAQLGLVLRAGEIVTTGTCLVPLEIQPSDRIVMDFGVLGRVEARMAAR
jgi:2-keto-4-pentenoate hydratase